MSNLLTGIAPQAGLIAGNTVSQAASQSARSAGGNTAQTQVVQQAVVSGSASNAAAVVNLSSDARTRAASYGEGRSVDSSFEKQRTGERGRKSSGEKSESRTVSVTA